MYPIAAENLETKYAPMTLARTDIFHQEIQGESPTLETKLQF